MTTDRTQQEPTVGTVEAREALAAWLRRGRTQRKLSLEDVAKVTKIQPRILDKLERGELEGLPADVFVRGFVRSFAKCVGLDEGEAVIRYGACQSAEAAASPTARALVESMGLTKKKSEPITEDVAEALPVVEAAPVTAVEAPITEAIVEIAAAAKGEPPTSKKKRSRKRKSKKSKQSTNLAVAIDEEHAPPQPMIVDGAVEQVEPHLAEGSQRISTGKIEAVVVAEELGAEMAMEAPVEAPSEELVTGTTAGSWQPTMPPISTAPSVPWRRPTITASPTYSIPTLVIDDADPDSADREREDRSGAKETRLSFLPPILLDREDRSARQGGLTLAVIILLIAATLTLSYLMRRPSASGDGVTMSDGSSELLS